MLLALRVYAGKGRMADDHPSYVFPVPLGHKPDGLLVYCNWYQPAKGGVGVYSYTKSDINPVPFAEVIRKVTMQQQSRSKKWQLSDADRAALDGGSWRCSGGGKGKAGSTKSSSSGKGSSGCGASGNSSKPKGSKPKGSKPKGGSSGGSGSQHLHVVQHQHKHRSLSLLGPSTSPRENRRDLRCKHQRTRIHLRGETETSRIEKYGTAVK